MKTILIIDDEEPFRLMLEELFTGEGYRVIGAGNGEQGIRLARAHHPDAILSDVDMPEGNGHEALAEFRKTPGLDAIPVIMMTGKADLPGMRKSMELGADDYLAKPFPLPAAINVIEQHLAKSAARREAAAGELKTLRRNLGELLPSDLVEPLHEIVGCASVLEVDSGLLPAEEVRDFAHSILLAAENLNRKIENFVLYSKLETETLETSAGQPVELSKLVREATEQVARRHRRLEMLRFDLTPAQAVIARELLAKVVHEIVDNACRYSIATEPIDVRLSVGEKTFTIVIRDHGMGFPEKATNGTATTSGHLGLKLAQQLTTALGGTWELDNQPKRGVCAQLTFPTKR